MKQNVYSLVDSNLIAIDEFKNQRELTRKLRNYESYLGELNDNELQHEIHFLLTQDDKELKEEFYQMGISLLGELQNRLHSPILNETIERNKNDLSERVYFVSRKLREN